MSKMTDHMRKTFKAFFKKDTILSDSEIQRIYLENAGIETYTVDAMRMEERKIVSKGLRWSETYETFMKHLRENSGIMLAPYTKLAYTFQPSIFSLAIGIAEATHYRVYSKAIHLGDNIYARKLIIEIPRDLDNMREFQPKAHLNDMRDHLAKTLYEEDRIVLGDGALTEMSKLSAHLQRIQKDFRDSRRGHAQ